MANYLPPIDPWAVDLDLSSNPYYQPPIEPGVADFNLVESGDGGGDVTPPISYPIPPDHMVARTFGVLIASGNPASDGGHSYVMTPGQKDVRDRLRFHAATIHNDMDGQGWDKLTIKDDSDDATRHSWAPAANKDPDFAEDGWRVVPKKDIAGGQAQLWDFVLAKDSGNLQGYVVPEIKDVASVGSVIDSAKYWEFPSVVEVMPYLPTNNFNFDLAPYGQPDPLEVNFNIDLEDEPDVVNVPTRPIYPRSGAQGWDKNRNTDSLLRHLWDKRGRQTTDVTWDYPVEPEPPPEPAERPAQPIIQEVYIFMPSVSLYRLPDGAEIEAVDVSWSGNSDSWGWTFSATLKRDADLALLKPDGNGPKEIACEINGHLFKGIVKGYSPTRAFGQKRIAINGVSLSGLLSSPYAVERSRVVTTAYTAQQLAEQELEATDWVLDWQSPDWLVPANAFSYENMTPISAIKKLAEAAGSVLQTHPSDKVLVVRPRYPFSPHNWTSEFTQLDAILPADFMQQVGANYKNLPLYNRAIVAGGSTGGVIVTTTMDGSAGDILAPLVTNELITAPEVGHERGRIEIARGGSWEEMNISAWLTDLGVDPGLLVPGSLVEVQDTAETYVIQIASTNVRATRSDNKLTVRQQLTADRSLTHG